MGSLRDPLRDPFKGPSSNDPYRSLLKKPRKDPFKLRVPGTKYLRTETAVTQTLNIPKPRSKALNVPKHELDTTNIP